MDVATGRTAAERVRTVLDRAEDGIVEFGLLRRRLRALDVRADGTLLARIDTVGDRTDVPGSGSAPAGPGASAVIEVHDRVCLGVCPPPVVAPSFALDGRVRTVRRCGPGCEVVRGVVRVRAMVGLARPEAAGSAMVALRIRPWEMVLTDARGAWSVPPGALAGAVTDPLAAVEQDWLRRLNGSGSAAGPGAALARHLASRAERLDPDVRPRVVGIDRFGLDVAVEPLESIFRSDLRVDFPSPVDTAEDLGKALVQLGSTAMS